MKMKVLEDFSKLFNELLKIEEITITGVKTGMDYENKQWIAIECEGRYKCAIIFKCIKKKTLIQVRYYKGGTFGSMFYDYWNVANDVRFMCKYGIP